jgi:hypothetical protein
VELVVSFGPTSSLLAPRAVAYARAHATTFARVAPRTWRAGFSLGTDPGPYGRCWRLLCLVGGWRGTEVEVQGSPEPLAPVLAMAACAREWLRRTGACRASFPSGPWPKCERCPLYDPGWAAESFAPLTAYPWNPPADGPVPDYPPEG